MMETQQQNVTDMLIKLIMRKHVTTISTNIKHHQQNSRNPQIFETKKKVKIHKNDNVSIFKKLVNFTTKIDNTIVIVFCKKKKKIT